MPQGKSHSDPTTSFILHSYWFHSPILENSMKLCKLNARLTYHSGIGSYQPFMVGLYLAKNHIADD